MRDWQLLAVVAFETLFLAEATTHPKIPAMRQNHKAKIDILLQICDRTLVKQRSCYTASFKCMGNICLLDYASIETKRM